MKDKRLRKKMKNLLKFLRSLELLYLSLESFKEFSHPSNQRDCPFKYVGMGVCLHCDEEARCRIHHKVFFFWGVEDLGIVSN